MIKEGAAVIDVGITRVQDPVTAKPRLVGDVDFEGEERLWIGFLGALRREGTKARLVSPSFHPRPGRIPGYSMGVLQRSLLSLSAWVSATPGLGLAVLCWKSAFRPGF